MTVTDYSAEATHVELGARLRSERTRMGLTQAEFAIRTGVSKTTQGNYEAGWRAPDALYLRAAAEAGLDLLYVVSGQARAASTMSGDSSDVVAVPLLGVRAAAGNGAVNESEAEYNVGGLWFSRPWLRERSLKIDALRVIEIRGASMTPVLANGDRVLVDLRDQQPRTGFVYVIRQGDELLAKYCQLMPGGTLRVSSANPQFATYDVDLAKTPDMAIVGRIVASMHEW